MKVNFAATFVNLDGSPAADEVGTLGAVAANALLDPRLEGDGTKKAANYELALRVFKAGELDIESQDVGRIKDAIGRFCAPILVGQAFRLLEGK